MQNKKHLREKFKAKLRSLKSSERRKLSRKIGRKLFRLEAFKNAARVFFYVSLGSEVDTASMIDKALKMGKRVFVPLTHLENKEIKFYEIKNRLRDLRPGTFGIPEPRALRSRRGYPYATDCVVVPGVVFDRKNHRIGHGSGFYDRFLKNVSPRTFKVGLAYAFQVVSKIPSRAHDKKLDRVLTD
jgi:5-formyltetrahydrofolate cyclo-ligase